MCNDNIIDEYSNIIDSLGLCRDPELLTILANLTAILISQGRNSDQLNTIGNFISSTGALISTIALQKGICEEKVDKIKQIQDLKRQILELEKSLLS